MPKTFYNILVPVDFTAKNKWAIAKAVELANAFNCHIHLVHVVHRNILPGVPINLGTWLPYDVSAETANASRKLEILRDNYRQHLCDGKIEISLVQGNQYRELSRYIDQYGMDLVVVGLSRFNLISRIWSSVSISRLARKTEVPVLAIRSSGLVSHFKKIVLPVGRDIPVHRIKMAAMLARSFKSTIYLVCLRHEENVAEQVLNKALEIVQSISTIPVQSFLLEGKNLAKSTLDFSRRINADLILANPLREFHMPGWWNRITRKLLSYGSNIPVMTLHKEDDKTPSVSGASGHSLKPE